MGGWNIAAAPITGQQVKDLSFLLNHTSYVLATRMSAAFAEIGLAVREYCTLAHAMEGQYTQIELAKLTDMDKTTMLNTMDFLERSGYAQRTPSPADRRARIITVTPAGAELAKRGYEIADLNSDDNRRSRPLRLNLRHPLPATIYCLRSTSTGQG